MKLPKQRLTIDLDHKLVNWVMKKAVRENTSRNEAIARCIEGEMERHGVIRSPKAGLGLPDHP